MTLPAGTRLGSYEVIALLGEGGMGQVYRARDTKLNRDVALKILPDAFAADPERLARFHREAQLLASLNHPNIGHIYGLEEGHRESASGRGLPVSSIALVLELVPGPTLADRIARGPIPSSEALPIAIQIADALETAHNQGVIHRDLKPANVKVRDDGTVKVLDFGLAKALDPASASGELMNSPTITSPAMTQRGIILGTAAYMSPEQARGKAVDKRADIWAFGCVLHEMLTGAQTFGGETLTDVLASVVKNEPDMKALPADTPRLVRSVLRRCLQKDPAKRLHDIADARIELQEAMTEPEEPTAAASTTPGVREPRGHPVFLTSRWLLAAALLVAGLGAGALLMWALRPAEPKSVIRLVVTRPDGGPMGSQNANTDVAISEDGQRVAYTAGAAGSLSLGLRALNTLDTTTVGGAGNPIAPFMSPDGKWVGFFDLTSASMKKVSVSGGAPVTICRFDGTPRGASWGSDDRIVFATSYPTSGLLRVPAAGGSPEVLTKPDPSKGELDHWFPEVLPGATGVLFTIVPQQSAAEGSYSVALFETPTGTWRVLMAGTHPRFVNSGHIVFGVGNTLRAVAFDLASLQIRSDSIPVVERVVSKSSGAMSFDVAGNGTLAYLSGEPAVSLRSLAWIDRSGHEEDIPAPLRSYVYPRLSPDGMRLALDIRDQENDIWIWDFLRRTLSRLTIDPGPNRGLAWTPDGQRLAFTASRDGKETVYWQAADGSGAPERLTEGPDVQVPSAFTPDGKQLIFQQPGAAPFDLALVDVTVPVDQRRVVKLLNAAHNEANGEVSPDGKWIAYQSNESGQRDEIYVRPFPNVAGGGRWQVSAAGGTRPVWLRKTGRELFYSEAAPDGTVQIMAVPVLPGTTFSYGTPQVAVAKAYPPPGLQGRHYDVSADGKRFLLIKSTSTNQKAPELTVVLNWVEELRKLVPATR